MITMSYRSISVVFSRVKSQITMLSRRYITPVFYFNPQPIVKSPTLLQVRSFVGGSKLMATYEEVRNAGATGDILVIDVREPSELAETGVIPGSINIPLGQVEQVLRNMPAAEFLTRFNKCKPNKDSAIIFSCRSGKRSGEAQDIAVKLGFKDARNFAGGWLEWEQKIKT